MSEGLDALMRDVSQPRMVVSNFISIGNHCMPADILDRAGVRRFSGPFDWLFSSSKVVTHCLSDDFATFLDASYYEPVPDQQRHDPRIRSCNHRYYAERFRIRSMFNHFDMLEPKNVAYYERCVSRFRNAVKHPRPKTSTLLFHIDIYNRMTQDEFDQMASAVDDYSAGHAFVVSISVIADVLAADLPEVTLVSEHPNGHRRFSFRPTSRWEPLNFLEPINDQAIIRIIGSYQAELDFCRDAELKIKPDSGLSAILKSLFR